MPLNATHDANPRRSAEQIRLVLRAFRQHLGMDAEFVSELLHGGRVFRSSEPGTARSNGAHDAVAAPQHHTDGHEATMLLALQDDPPRTASSSVPSRHSGGIQFGTLRSLGPTFDDTATERTRDGLRLCADVISALLKQDRLAARDFATRKVRITRVLDAKSITMVFQPIYRTRDARLTGFEALARFASRPARPPDLWFAEAAGIGLGPDLEFLAIEKALPALQSFDPSLKLTLNLSPDAVLDPRFPTVFNGAPLDRIVIELTEHAVVPCYEVLRAALAPLQAQGLRLAIDDVGAGHSTLRHVVELAPELIKLDRSFIDNIHADPVRRALAEALTQFGRRVGCEVVAEGVETESDYAVLQAIGVTRAQGYVLGRPMPAGKASALPLELTALG